LNEYLQRPCESGSRFFHDPPSKQAVIFHIRAFMLTQPIKQFFCKIRQPGIFSRIEMYDISNGNGSPRKGKHE